MRPFIARLLSTLLLLACLTGAASAQRPLVKYTKFRAGREMPHTRVSCFYQDSLGFLWMGSWIGLCRYDGQQFQFFRSEPGNANPQSNNRVLRIGETPDGRLWCQTYDQQYYYFDRRDCTFAPMPPAEVPVLPTGHRQDEARDYRYTDAQGVRWVKPAGDGLYWLDTVQGRLRPVEEALAATAGGELPIRSYHIIYQDRQLNLWVSAGTELFRLTSQPRQNAFVALPDLAEVRALVAGGDGSGLVVAGDKAGHVVRMAPDGSGRQYLAPSGRWQGGAVRFAPQGVYCLLHDRSGCLWVGTRGAGLYRVAPTGGVERFSHSGDDPYSLSNNDVYDLLEDAQGRIWVATFEGGGLNLAVTEGGRTRFVSGLNEWKDDYPKEAKHVRCLAQDGRGRILFGTNDGLVIFDPEEHSWRLCKHAPGDPLSLPGNTVMSVATDPASGQVYVLSYGHSISRMTCEADGRVTFRHVTNPGFPAGDVAIAAQVDRRGRVWYVSESGITCFDPAAPEGDSLAPVGGTGVRFFDEYDFDAPYTFTEMRPLVLPSGQMLMGMAGGLFTCHTDSLRKSSACPALLFTRYGLPGTEGTEWHYVCDIDRLELDPAHRSVDIQFSAMDYKPSHLMRYACRMERADGRPLSGRGLPAGLRAGRDDAAGWTVSTQPEVNFVGLPAGRYVLTVRSTNADGVWCANDHRLVIDVVPTFWETRWAWLVWGLLFVALATLVGLAWAYVDRLHRQKVQLEAVLEQYLSQPAPLHGSPAPHPTPSAPGGPPTGGSAPAPPPQAPAGAPAAVAEAGAAASAAAPEGPRAAAAQAAGASGASAPAVAAGLAGRPAPGDGPAPEPAAGSAQSQAAGSVQAGPEAPHPGVIDRALDAMSAPETHSYDEEFMRRLMEYFELHIADTDLTVADFAEAMHMSQATFYRKVKNYVGLSPIDFFRKVRMRRAVQLFDAGEESIAQVAYSVGFSDPKYFSKCFKHDMGLSPVDYRQRVAERG